MQDFGMEKRQCQDHMHLCLLDKAGMNAIKRWGREGGSE